MKNTDCLFCKIVAGGIPANIIFNDDQVCAFYDIKPQAPEHILVIPKKHIATVQDMDVADEALFGKLIYTAKTIAVKNRFLEGSYRLVINNGSLAGQEVFHVHVHLLGGRKMTWPPG